MFCTFALCMVIGGFVPGPSPAGQPMFGFNDNSVAFGIAGARTVMARQAAIPARAGNVHRYTVDWRNVERARGTLHWQPYDAIYRQALAHGLRPLPILLNAPRWAKGAAGRCAPVRQCISPPDRTATGLAAWRRFAAAAARRWPRAVAIEVWNEPNLRSFWTTPEGADPSYYADVLCSAYRGVKTSVPRMTVLLGGLANPPTDEARGEVSLTDFLDALYRRGAARRCADAVSLHPYPAQRRPDGPGAPFLTHLAQARAVMARHGDTGRRLWVTEFGYFTGAAGISEWIQGRWLACAYRMAAGMPDVDAFLVHTLFDPGRNPAYREHNFGVLRHPAVHGGEPKPAYRALVRLFSRRPGGVPTTTSCDW